MVWTGEGGSVLHVVHNTKLRIDQDVQIRHERINELIFLLRLRICTLLGGAQRISSRFSSRGGLCNGIGGAWRIGGGGKRQVWGRCLRRRGIIVHGLLGHWGVLTGGCVEPHTV